MKKLYYLLFAGCMMLAACETPVGPEDPEEKPQDTTEVYVPLTEWEKADSMYTVSDYTVPSHTALKMAITACASTVSFGRMCCRSMS